MKPPRYRRAVGLRYEPRAEGDEAPALQVKGEALLADKIVALAERYGIPVVHDAQLARSLSHLSLDEQIPPTLFEAVAVLLTAIERTSTTARPALKR